MRFILTISLLLGSGLAWAVPVNWTLQDVSFNDGSTGIGSFVFDADTGVLSSVSLQTTARTDPDAIDYLGPYGGASFVTNCDPDYWNCDYSTGVNFTDLTIHATDGNDNELILRIDGLLTNAGGTLLLSGSEYDPEPGGGQGRAITSGQIVGVSTVPVPAAVWLFGSALGGLGWMRRRKIA